ncbi:MULTISPECIES: chorismate-binding protein [unclassified Bradyrhizobium]|uniref:chorismate-binding protein n=1 Tax=unclassified Bradyrhizobium TaxID=2631580 RepID=UPI0032AFAAD1
MDQLAFYCGLRSSNPARFAALLGQGKLTIASPERFLRLDGRRMEARSVKGTIAHSGTPRQTDAVLKSRFRPKRTVADR